MSCAVCFVVIFTLGRAAFADSRADIVRCRVIPNAQDRLHCLDAASEVAQRELDELREGEPAGTSTAAPVPLRAKVLRIEYVDRKPRFYLAGGQVWQSADARRLTRRADAADEVAIEKTPVGYLLHFNSSFFGLLVFRVDTPMPVDSDRR